MRDARCENGCLGVSTIGEGLLGRRRWDYGRRYVWSIVSQGGDVVKYSVVWNKITLSNYPILVEA